MSEFVLDGDEDSIENTITRINLSFAIIIGAEATKSALKQVLDRLESDEWKEIIRPIYKEVM